MLKHQLNLFLFFSPIILNGVTLFFHLLSIFHISYDHCVSLLLNISILNHYSQRVMDTQTPRNDPEAKERTRNRRKAQTWKIEKWRKSFFWQVFLLISMYGFTCYGKEQTVTYLSNSWNLPGCHEFQSLPSMFHKLIYISSKTNSPQLLHFDVLQFPLKMHSFYFSDFYMKNYLLFKWERHQKSKKYVDL